MTLRKLDQIQALRALAATAVMAGHAVNVVGGFGVDIFFVISGFVIAYVTQTETQWFLPKRIFRLVPLYWAATFFIFATALAAPGMVGTVSADFAGLLKSLLFIPYEMHGSVRPLLILGWTLLHEMFFYLLFAAALRISHRYRTVLTAIFLMLTVAAAALWGRYSLVLAYEGAPVVLEFILGFVVFHLWSLADRGRPLRRSWAVPLFCAAMAGVVALLFWTDVSMRVISWGLPAFLIVLAVLFAADGWRLPAWLVLLGDASYSLYLLHPYVLNLTERLVRPAAPWTAPWLGMALSIGVAIALWRLFEAPANRWLRARLPDHRPAVILQK